MNEAPDDVKETVTEGWTRLDDTKTGRTISVHRPIKAALLVELQADEKANLGYELAAIYIEAQQLEAEKKEWVALWKSRKEKLLNQQAAKIDSIRTGHEMKIVETDEVFDHIEGKHFYSYKGEQYQPRAMKDAEYLIGAPTLFDFTHVEKEGAGGDSVLVASSVEGNVTKLTGRGKRLTQPSVSEVVSERDREIRSVMREESSVRGKTDHVSSRS